MKVGQLTNELSEMNSQLMVKEKELTKLKEDNKLLEKDLRDRKSNTVNYQSTLPDSPGPIPAIGEFLISYVASCIAMYLASCAHMVKT